MCPPFTLIVHLKACKRDFERVIGEKSIIAAISGSRAVRDLLSGLRDPLSCLAANFKTIAQYSSKSSNLFKVGSLHIVLEVGDGCKPSCYDFNLKSCK
jgi:hypothetical protein